MTSKLISTQKVIKTLEKAGLPYNGGVWGTGYYASKSFADAPEIQVSYRFSRSSKHDSPTLARIEKLAEAAKVLTDAGLPVYMSANLGNFFDGNLYVWRDVSTQARSTIQPWSTYMLKDVYAEKIEAEQNATKAEKERQAERNAQQQAEANAALTLTKKQNPAFHWQGITAAGSVRTCEVYYNDGRRAIVTIFIGATKGRYGLDDFDVIDLKIGGVEQDAHNTNEWDTIRAHVTATTATETVEDLLWAWLSQQG